MSAKSSLEWHRNHPERVKEIQKKYYLAHKEKRKAYLRQWRLKNRSHYNELIRKWRKLKHRTDPVYREKERQWHRDSYKRNRAWYILRGIRQNKSFAEHSRKQLRAAIVRGEVIRPDRCDACKTLCKPDAHHYKGYKYPLDVIWLCDLCHGEIHAKYD